MQTTLIVLSTYCYALCLSVSTDMIDAREVKYVNENNFDAVKEGSFDNIVYVGDVTDETRKQFRSLVKE